MKLLAASIMRAIALMLCFVVSQAHSQQGPIATNAFWMMNFAVNQQMMAAVNKPILEKAELESGRRAGAARVGGRADLAATSTAFREQGAAISVSSPTLQLAQSYPESKRAEAERVFVEMLRGYRKIKQQFGIQRNDVAGAVAAFLVGSYMAYQNTGFPDAHFKPLVDQLGPIIARSPEFTKATNGNVRICTRTWRSSARSWRPRRWRCSKSRMPKHRRTCALPPRRTSNSS